MKSILANTRLGGLGKGVEMGVIGRLTKGLAGAAAVLLFIGVAAALFGSFAGAAGAAGSQYVASTQHITSGTGGGDCGNIGTWNSSTDTCTLGGNLAFASGAGIEIDSNSVTLNGGGYTMTGAGDNAADGVYLPGISGATVEKVTIDAFNNGVNLTGGQMNTVQQVATSGNGNTGISLTNANNNMVMSNNSNADGVGINLASSAYNTIMMNMVMGATMGDGISLQDSPNNSFTSNSSDMNAGNGYCIDPGNDNNSFTGNEASGNANNGFWLNQSDGNTIVGNTSTNNNMSGMSSSMGSMAGQGEISLQDSSNNQIYHNNFTSSSTPQASVTGTSTGNVFNLPAPVGGNYWSSWTSPDSDNDGFVDSPYVFMGGQDNLPLTAPVGSGKPSLGLGAPTSFWASLSDFDSSLLSVTWTVSNTGTAEAWSVQLTGSSNTNGVTLASTLPAAVGSGDILPGASGTATLKYSVPAGVTAWVSALSGSAEDGVGATYTYP